MSVPFEELEGSPTVSIGPEGTVARRIFRVAWTDWLPLARQLIGSYRRVGEQFHFVPPLEFPDLPGVVVTALDVAPMDPENPDGAEVHSLHSGTNRYPAAGARITATYATLPDPTEPPRGDLPAVPHGTYLTFRADLGSDFITTPNRGWHWEATDDPPLPPDVHPGVVIPTGVFRLIWHRVAVPNWTAMRQLRGKVNAATFVGGPPGTVLFLGARVVREFEFGRGFGFWRVEYLFSERAIDQPDSVAGWNHMYKEQPVEGQHWVRVLNVAGQFQYTEADLTPLFAFGP
ncbi:MAG: hypothetical protein K8T91_17785 [Planctomycetes bacterium]|nr:hypothetical protein [Planctomycetota bacterium]